MKIETLNHETAICASPKRFAFDKMAVCWEKAALTQLPKSNRISN